MLSSPFRVSCLSWQPGCPLFLPLQPASRQVPSPAPPGGQDHVLHLNRLVLPFFQVLAQPFPQSPLLLLLVSTNWNALLMKPRHGGGCSIWEPVWVLVCSLLLGWPLFLGLSNRPSVCVCICTNTHIYFETKIRTIEFLLNLLILYLYLLSLTMRDLILKDSWSDRITYLLYSPIYTQQVRNNNANTTINIFLHFLLFLGYVAVGMCSWSTVFQCHLFLSDYATTQYIVNSFVTFNFWFLGMILFEIFIL